MVYVKTDPSHLLKFQNLIYHQRNHFFVQVSGTLQVELVSTVHTAKNSTTIIIETAFYSHIFKPADVYTF